jgi:hypothetical protein
VLPAQPGHLRADRVGWQRLRLAIEGVDLVGDGGGLVGDGAVGDLGVAQGHVQAGFVDVDGAQKLVDTLNTHGLKADTPQPAEPGYVQGVGGTGWNLDINAGGFGDGINLFPNREALSAWVELSKALAHRGDRRHLGRQSRLG